ncbi:MAG: hypothetical protein ACI9BO_002544, partial [Zhongshania sp.]
MRTVKQLVIYLGLFFLSLNGQAIEWELAKD